MTDTTAGDIQKDDAEKHYGHIPDRLAWNLPLGSDVTTDSGFQVFTGRAAPESKKADARSQDARNRAVPSSLPRRRRRERVALPPRRLDLDRAVGRGAVLRGEIQARRRPGTRRRGHDPIGGDLPLPMQRGQRARALRGAAATATRVRLRRALSTRRHPEADVPDADVPIGAPGAPSTLGIDVDELPQVRA